jgi:hypothetical protein
VDTTTKLQGILRTLSRALEKRPPRQGGDDALTALAHRTPHLYVSLVVLAAGVGCAYLASFPLITLFLFLDLGAFVLAPAGKSLLAVGLQAAVAATAGIISYQLFRIQPPLPNRRSISIPEKSPLASAIAELSRDSGSPAIHQLGLTERFGLEVVRTPRSGFPLLHRNTLLIGLPLLASLSPLHVQILLARELGRLADRHHPLTGRLTQLRETWAQLGEVHDPQRVLAHFALKAFFPWFAPLYARLALPVARLDAQYADSHALERYNDQDVLETLFTTAIAEKFLEQAFWPKVFGLSREHREPRYLPYSDMHRAARDELTREDALRWLEEAIAQDTERDAPLPSLRERMEALGCAQAWLPPPVKTSAAAQLLGTALAPSAERLDREWRAEVLHSWTSRYHETREARQQMNALYQRARSGVLTVQEAHTYARLAEAYLDEAQAIAVHKSILKMDMRNAALNFSIGSFLASRRDAAGIRALMESMVQDERYAVPARRLLAQFHAQAARAKDQTSSRPSVAFHRPTTA